MTCSDVERALPELLDGKANGAFPTEVQSHVESCPACSGLISDLETIAGEARHLAASEEPPQRVWVRIAAELRAEGLIHDQEPESAPVVVTRPTLVPALPRRRWTSTAWWLAPVAAALLVAGAYVAGHKPAPQVAKQQAPSTLGMSSVTATAVPATAPVAKNAAATSAPAAPTPRHEQVAQKLTAPAGMPRPAVEPESSLDDQQFLSVVSTRAPSMRATYESQLQAVNADIRETQLYVDRNPGDADARQHLMDAYQQKALLYQIALDRIQ